MKKFIALLWALALSITLIACSGKTIESTAVAFGTQPVKESSTVVSTSTDPEVTLGTIAVEYDSDDLDSNTTGSDISYIKLEGNSITLDGSNATVNDSVITITSAGVYSISGILDDGQIIIDTQDKETVVLILNGANIACSTSAPIYMLNAEKTVITLADGTENAVTDGASYILENPESDEPNAAIFSNDDLTINGTGSLIVNANYNNGIASKDNLKITGGNITVNAVNDGIKGRNYIAVKDGTITVNAGGDGLQSNNDEDAEKGYILIEGGTLNITAGMDGIQAETRLMISGGDIAISSGGGSVNGSSKASWGNWGTENNTADSAKGLKAGVDVTITGGTITIDSSDDAVHSNTSITIDGGDILLTSGDDGIHSDSTLEINGGDINITQSYEGIESATITINDGSIRIVASDDGINTAGGVDSSALNGRPGQNEFAISGNYHLYIHGGYVAVDAVGDGIDSNGPMDMTAGVVIINGPTSNGNGPLDYMGTFNITGGFLVAVGSSGMAQAPSMSSTQYSVMHNFTSPQAAGTLVHIETKDGEDILTFVPTKAYQSVLLSSPELKNGSTYVVYSGGSSTGTVTDSLYSGGTYTAGAPVTSLTISSMVTGGTGGGFPGGGGRTRPGGGRP
ncbi:MAG: carbohydrate-binding domain-containing protein [Anaerolineae bacterium]|nr:carbohydrate-binding domain-containing protein [Anaerolineae bacterium]